MYAPLVPILHKLSSVIKQIARAAWRCSLQWTCSLNVTTPPPLPPPNMKEETPLLSHVSLGMCHTPHMIYISRDAHTSWSAWASRATLMPMSRGSQAKNKQLQYSIQENKCINTGPVMGIVHNIEEFLIGFWVTWHSWPLSTSPVVKSMCCADQVANIGHVRKLWYMQRRLQSMFH